MHQNDAQGEIMDIQPLRVGIYIDLPNFNRGMRRNNLEIRTFKLLASIGAQIIRVLPDNLTDFGIRYTVRKLFYDYHPDIDTDAFRTYERFIQSFAHPEVDFSIRRVQMNKYADKTIRHNLIENGSRISPFKSVTDTTIVAEAMEDIVNNEFDVLVMFSGDSDLEVLNQKAQQYGKHVIFFSARGITAQNIYDNVEHLIDISLLDCCVLKYETGTYA